MEFILKNKISELNKLAQELKCFCDDNKLSEQILFDINLSLDELVTNIISYGFKDEDEHDIFIRIVKNGNKVEIVLEDEGREFNPLNEKNPEIATELDDMEVGGLGIYFVKKKMDEINYKWLNGKNILKLEKQL